MHPFLWSLSIFCWQDIAEIITLFVIFLYVSLWLSQDTTKPLLTSFYFYISACIITDLLHMPTVHMLLLLCMPIYFISTLLIHKNTLQKKFIPVRSITNTTDLEECPWPEIVIQTTLIAASNNIELLYALEQTDQLLPYMDECITLNAPITKELLLLITSSPKFNPQHTLIVTPQGKLESLAHSWKKDSLEQWFTKEAQEQKQWIQDALFFTTKTDAFIFKYDLITRSFTTIEAGSITHGVNAPTLINELTNRSIIHNGLPPSSYKFERKSYVPTYQQKSTQQPFDQQPLL